jgi:hypothetical protein
MRITRAVRVERRHSFVRLPKEPVTRMDYGSLV